GYDSVGIATLNNKINLKKGDGKTDVVFENELKNSEKIVIDDLKGSCGIAHIRWATHGLPNKINTHPHTDKDRKIAVVQNGIIENYLEIKEELINEGYSFISETDTEILPYLISKYMNKGLDLESALRETVNMIEGNYSIVVISDDEKKIVAVRKTASLIAGIGEDGYFISSDTAAILDYAQDIIYPEDEEILILTEDGIVIKDKYDKIVDYKTEHIDWSPELAQKEGYDYFMLKEINDQSLAMKNALVNEDDIKKIVDDLNGEINRICFVACGTSYHASLTAKYLIENLSGIPTEVIVASEFKYSINTLDDKSLVIFISQSGETADTISAIDALGGKSKTLSIVNVVGSSMSRKTDYVIYAQAGPEIAIAATKSYICQLTAVYLFAALLSGNDKLLNNLKKVPDYIDDVLTQAENIKEVSKKYKYADDFFFIGRGYSYPIALEGALKLKEVTYIHAEGYAAGELKHGPLALIDYNVPIVTILPPGKDHNKTMANLEEVKSRGADVLAIGSKTDSSLKVANDVFYVNPEVDEILAPLVYIIPLQLLSYYIAVEKNLDPDSPRNLTKSVTVE
ncbi:glutamine--fructose-6-phosphate transaminase (isomerizing), partial [Methanobrevibacter sp. OttesenSCG-928-K11]|nr:glutamine--fructose-6-phosphate transaminase (isomerizing) [Methanobrevibacter sp. OttesenSCG-928-K11]